MALVSTAAWATVTFDSTTGSGFVGKGDVQLALGLNNAQMQAQAGSLSFTDQDIATYDVYCQNDNGHNVLEQTFPRQRHVNATVAYDARSHKQVDGFNLSGFSAGNTGNNPIDCPGGWTPDPQAALNAGVGDGTTYIIVTSSSGAGLYVNGVLLYQLP